MTQNPPQLSLNASRLVRFLSDLAVSNVEISHEHFSERLGSLIDLSGSIKLSEAHSKLSRLAFELTTDSTETVKASFLRVRASIVQSIIKSFIPGGPPSRIRLPKPKVGGSTEKTVAYEPYLKFYVAHQIDIHSRVQSLQSQVREAVSGLSPELAQLSALDAAVGDALAVRSRDFFAIVPRLLEKRFKQLHDEQQQDANNPDSWLQAGGGLEQFCSEMRGLLLAELEVRLQPVLGLVEAVNEKVNVIND